MEDTCKQRHKLNIVSHVYACIQQTHTCTCDVHVHVCGCAGQAEVDLWWLLHAVS